MTGWRDIASAPRDGTWILVCGGQTCDDDEPRTHAIAQWSFHLNGTTLPEGRWMFAWYDGGYYGDYEGPTHWIPLDALPLPPTNGANNEG